MLNLYQYHTSPEKLVQRGQQANLIEVFNYIRSYLNQYEYHYNEDPDGIREVSVSIDDSGSDSYNIHLRYTEHTVTTKRVVIYIIQREAYIALSGNVRSIHHDTTHHRLDVFKHGEDIDTSAIDDWLDDTLN